MIADPPSIISTAVLRFAKERASDEGRPVAEIIARILRLGVAAAERELLTVRGQRRRAEHTLPKAA